MMGLRKTVNTLLRLPDPHERNGEITHRYQNIPSPDVAGLRCISSDIPKPSANVLESSVVVVPSKLLPGKPDPGINSSRFQPCDGAGGLELCTESLGFESCCEWRMGESVEEEIPTRKKTRSSRRAEAKKFPPPLPWLMNSRPGGAFMRSVRKDGRFVLTEVRVERPEILLASRQDGRLRLQLFNEHEVEEIGREEAAVQEEATEEMEGDGEDEERVRLWKAAMKRSDGWTRTCQSAVSPHHLSSCSWIQHCLVTTALSIT